MKNNLLPPTSFLKGDTRQLYRLIAFAITLALLTPYTSLAVTSRARVTAKAYSLPLAAAPAVTPPWDPFFANQTTIADFGAGTRPLGVAAGDFDGDSKADIIVGRISSGAAAFTLQKGNGDGTFATATAFAWRLQTFNAWTITAADLNGDNYLDLLWSSTQAAHSGCTSPVPTGQTCATVGGTTVTINPGDVRVLYGNGNGTFQENAYFISTVRYAAGQLLGRITPTATAGTTGTGAGSLAVADIDGDSDLDVVAGGVDGSPATTSVIKLLRNDGGGTFTISTLVSQPAVTTLSSPIYYPSVSAQNSPWGLALGDADGDGDKDLFVGDRALYIYLYKNNGSGAFTLTPGDTVVSGTRPNIYLAHEGYRASLGFTPSLAAGDINGDGKADLVLGLHSGTQTPASNTANDGVLLLNVSTAGGHTLFGPLADVGTMARGVRAADINADGALDLVAGEYDGKVKYLRQLPPADDDGDGISNYVDNAPGDPNRARIDMNGDGAVNYLDQLDNDADTVLGDPENQSSWQRLGDAVDPDDDNDGVLDADDNCAFTANADQADRDSDGRGDVCDPLDNRDSDGDGVPNGPAPGDPLYEAAKAAKAKWSTGTTHFIIRIDALGRFFQNEFTQLMTDAATLSPEVWQTKCWENYQSDDIINGAPYEPCGNDATQPATLGGGKEVPVTLVVIPKQLWTDAPVVAWINDRNDNPLFELGQHGTYHQTNTMNGDWATLSDRNFFSCEPCGLTLAESFELLRIGHDTLLGNYGNKWVAESGATPASPKIDWVNSANQLLSYAPPFNADDPTGRQATAMLGFKAHSSSIFEEGVAGGIGQFFTPEGSHHEQFDQFGMFHASADLELEPPDTTGDSYNPATYEAYLQANTTEGGLNTWLIEEVEWSGRPCNNDDRLGTCNGGSNRENNTVYAPRWNAWLQLLDYVKNYPGGVAMTMGEVALAKGFDNAPTVPNADQADSDHDGIGDVIDGASVSAGDAALSRNQSGNLSATLTNGGTPIAGQTITFTFDADGDSTAETFTGTTNGSGTATVSVTTTRPVGEAAYEVSWNGGLGITSTDSGVVTVRDATNLALDGDNPSSGQVTDQATFGATLTDSDGLALSGQTVTFTVGSATGSGTTDASGQVEVTLTLAGPAASTNVQASFAGAGLYGESSASAPFTVSKEDTVLTLSDAVANKSSGALASAVLKETDGAPLAGKTIEFYVQSKVKGSIVYTLIGTATTGAGGTASFEIPTRYVSKTKTPIRAVFAADASFNGASADAFTYR